MTRRRLLASAGLAATVGAASVAGAAGTDGVEQPSSRALDPPAVRWNRAYGPRSYNSARSILETNDGSLVVLGGAQESQYGSGADWLFSVDATTGEGQWSHVFEGGEEPFSTQAVAPADDGFVLLETPSQGDRSRLRQVSTDGEETWSQAYEPSIEGESTQLLGLALQAVDDGYLVAGYVARDSDTTSADAATALALKVDTEGTEQWRHYFLEDRLALVQTLTADGDGYVASGVMRQPPENEDERPPVKSVLFRFDEEGSVTWQTELVETNDGQTNQANRVVDHASTEDGYLLVGVTGGLVDSSAWVVAADADGSVRTTRTVGPDAEEKRLRLSSVTAGDGTAYATGMLTDQSADGTRAWLGAMDANAELGWTETAARKQTNQFQDVVTTSDGGIAIAGQAQTDDDTADTPGEAWLVKLGGEAAATPTATPEPTDSPSPTPSPTPEPTATPEPTDSPTPEPTEMATDEPTEADDAAETTSDDGAGFGVGTALAALGGGALLRRGDSTESDDAE